jgi:ribosomal-protein-serine acetyltransferase
MLRFELRSGCYLRLFEESDAEELERVIAANRVYLAKWLAWANETGGEAWLEFIRRTREKVGANDGFVAAIIDGDAIVGWVGFDHIDWDSRSTSIGYWLARDRQGRGIMTEAVAALTAYAFDVWKLNRVEIRVAVGNQRSAAIAQRLGFRDEGILRQRERHDDSVKETVVYSILAREWTGLHWRPASRDRQSWQSAGTTSSGASEW